MDNSPIDPNISDKYYDEVNEYYNFLAGCVTPEDYEVIKSELEYDQSYDEHIASLFENIPSREKTIKQIESFLDTYVEFRRIRYLEVIKELNRKARKNSDHFKTFAFQLLVKQHKKEKEDQEMTDVDPDFKPKRNESEIRRDNTMKSRVRAQIGNSNFEIPTHDNPLMSCLTSILISWFSINMLGITPTHL